MSGLKTNFSRSPTNFSRSPSYSFYESLHHKSLALKPKLSVKRFIKKPTQHTSYFIEHINLSRKDKIMSTISEQQQKGTQKQTCFGAYLYSAGTQHGNLSGEFMEMKTTLKGHKNRNRHKNRIKRSGQTRLWFIVKDKNRNIPTT